MLRRFKIGPVAPFGPIGWMNSQLMDMVQVAKLGTANTMLSSMMLAQRSAETASLLAKLPWYGKAKQKLGPGWRDKSPSEVTQAIAEGLNNAIGPINVNMVNQEGVFNLFERFFILTPSWTRGNIGQIVNAAKVSTTKGLVARWLLMNQLSTGALLSTKLSMAFSGEMPSFDPRDNDFLAAKLPWGRFAVMPAMPVYRLPVRLMLGRGGDFESLEGRWTEFLRFAEGRMGQVPRIAIDLVQGQDFLGRRIDDKSAFLVKELFPIIGQEILETRKEGGVSNTELAQRLFFEFLGSSVIPKTPFQLERERVEEITGIPFEEVPKAQLRRLRKSDEQLVAFRKRQQVYRQERGGALNQFFTILEERTEEMQFAIDAFLDATPSDSPGFMAKFSSLSRQELSDRAVAADAAKEALGIEEEDINKAPTKILQDALAIEYWTIRPELEECVVSEDADACENNAWNEFRDRREDVLRKAPNATIREYIIGEFPATRYAGNAVAEDLERRRVAAQIATNEFFDTSPYLLIDGKEMQKPLLDAVFDVRKDINQLVIQVGRILRESTGDPTARMPSGSRRRIIASLLEAEAGPLRQQAYAWQILWETSRLQDFLRNPRRDEILLANTDMIKFRPDIFGRFIRRNEIIDRLGGDPELLRIASEQG